MQRHTRNKHKQTGPSSDKDTKRVNEKNEQHSHDYMTNHYFITEPLHNKSCSSNHVWSPHDLALVLKILDDKFLRHWFRP